MLGYHNNKKSLFVSHAVVFLLSTIFHVFYECHELDGLYGILLVEDILDIIFLYSQMFGCYLCFQKKLIKDA